MTCNNKIPNSFKYEKVRTYVTVNFIRLFWIYQSTVLVAECEHFSDRIITEYYTYTHEAEIMIDYDLVKTLFDILSW